MTYEAARSAISARVIISDDLIDVPPLSLSSTAASKGGRGEPGHSIHCMASLGFLLGGRSHPAEVFLFLFSSLGV